MSAGAGPRSWGALLALLLVSALLAMQAWRFPGPRYDRFELPAFDAHAYIAMSEHPAFFTVAPWGYRLLTPAVVRALPVRTVVRGFRYVTLGSLAAAGLLLFLYLRRLGHGVWPSLLAVAVFPLSGPVWQVLRARFLVEPLTLLLELALLLSLETAAGPGALTLLVCLGVLSKESFLLLVPLLYLGRRRRDGDARALLLAAVAGGCGLVLLLGLRWWWTPHIHAPWPRPGPELLALGLERFRESWKDWWPSVLLSGLTPLAVLGF